MQTVSVSHQSLPIRTEIRIDTDNDVISLKEKLYSISGSTPANVVLLLRNSTKGLITLEPNYARLKSFGIRSGDEIIIVDRDPAANVAHAFMKLDTAPDNVRVRMSEEDYSKRTGIVLKEFD